MDLLHNPNRAQHPSQDSSNNAMVGNAPVTSAAAAPHPSKNRRDSKMTSLKGLTVLLFLGIVVILLALVAYVVNGQNTNESSYVNSSDYQAVFVNIAGTNGGQAYFGHITSINTQYVILSNVFYLEPGASTNQFTLNNLSCALYNPSDQMVIERSQVAYWENLKSNSQVTSDITKWINDKLTCSSTSSAGTASTPSSGTNTTTH